MGPSGTRKIHLITNVKAGRGFGKDLTEAAARLCHEHGVDFYSYEIKEGLDVETQTSQALSAAQKDGGIIAVAGGDGTLRYVTQKVQALGLVFAVIPCGTFNFFARAHQIPEDPLEALKLAITGTPRPVRLGEINGEVFLVNASLGLYAKAIRERERRTSRWGRKRVVVIFSTLLSLWSGHWLLQMEIKTNSQLEWLETPLIFIGNNPLQLKSLSSTAAHCLDQDLLAVMAMRPLTKWKTLKLIFKGLRGHLQEAREVRSFCISSMLIKTRGATLTVAMDGEMFKMTSPLQVRSRPGALNLIRPSVA